MDTIGFDERRVEGFWDFVTKRQAIWHRRFIKGQEAPWTDDPILRDHRFTNIYRRLDPGTEYAESIMRTDAPRPDRFFNLMIYRLIGKKETHAELGFQHLATFDPQHMVRTLHAIRDRGDKPFTAAYMVSGYTQFGSADKAQNVAELFDRLRKRFPILWSKLEATSSGERAFTILESIDGFGPFLAYQVLVDSMYDVDQEQLLPLRDDAWAKAGPGAKRGIRILVPDAKTDDELAIMKRLHADHVKELVKRGFDWWVREKKPEPLRLSDVQNCLCEYHKYVKIGDGSGRARRKYP